MTVFKGYLRIIRKNLYTILMYIAIFAGISVLIQNTYLGTGAAEGFSSLKIGVAVIDRENGALGAALKKVMQRDQKLVELEDDRHVFQEALYYREVEYILVVPKGAGEKLLGGENALESITVPGSVTSFYVESQVNSLLNEIRVYESGGYSFEEACEKASGLGEVSPNVKLIDLNGNAGVRPAYNYFMGYMPYAFLGAVIMTIGFVVMEFKKKDLRRRMAACAVPFLQQNLAEAGAFLVVGVFVWTLCMVIQVIMHGAGIFASSNAVYYLLNSVSFMLVALSLAYLAGIFAGTPSSLNGINNIISLGMCFLGGIFVPLEMLGEGIRKAAQFLPTYWYSTVNGILGDYESVSRELMGTVWKGYLIQLLFAAACFGIALTVRRIRLQEKS